MDVWFVSEVAAMSDIKVLWASNEGTMVYRAPTGETILMQQVGRQKKKTDITVSKAGMTIAEELIPLEEISKVTSRIIISFYAVYFVEILLKNGERILVYHIRDEGTLSEFPLNLDTYLLLVALCEVQGIAPPPFENPQTHGKWAIRLILFWIGFVIVALVSRSLYLLSLAAIPLFFAGYLLLNDGIKYRNYEGGRNLARGGAVLAILSIVFFISASGLLGGF